MNNTGIFCSSVSVFEAMAAYDTGFPFSVVCASSFSPFCPHGSILVSPRCLSSIHPLPSSCPNPLKWQFCGILLWLFSGPTLLFTGFFSLQVDDLPTSPDVSPDLLAHLWCYLWTSHQYLSCVLETSPPCSVLWIGRNHPNFTLNAGETQTLSSDTFPSISLHTFWQMNSQDWFYFLPFGWALEPAPSSLHVFCCLGSDPILLSGVPVLTSSSSLPVSDLNSFQPASYSLA